MTTPKPADAANLTAVPPAIHADERYAAITTPDQALLYMNAQNLVDAWNNIIIQAKTGDEQLKLMRESGVFADDVKLTFNFEEQKLVLNGLDAPETHEFYNGFVNSLKKNRYNIASNVEAVELLLEFQSLPQLLLEYSSTKEVLDLCLSLKLMLINISSVQSNANLKIDKL